jgi:hypothetical protein
MRLVNTDLSRPFLVLRTQEFIGSEVPDYAILSRTTPSLTVLRERFALSPSIHSNH